MNIKKLTIHGFGQFVNKTFDFNEGLNVIEGLNESGKTTLHAFIEAMFYGFINPQIKVKKTLDIYDRYEPKASDVYGGSMLIELNGKTYRIERNLKKRNRDPLRVFDETTGKDITSTLDVDPIAKTADIAAFINIPYTLYQNTLSIRQLELETESSVGDLLMTRLSNLMQSKTETISPEKARETLKKQLDEIGSERASTKPYAQTLDEIKERETEIQSIESVHQALLEDKATLEQQKRETEDLKSTLSHHEETLKQKENSVKRTRFETIKKFEQEKHDLEEKRNQLAIYKDLDPEDVERFYVASERVSAHKETRADLARKADQLRASITEQEDQIETPTYTYKAILQDLEALKALTDLFDETSYEAAKTKQAFLTTKHTKWQTKKDSIIRKTRFKKWLFIFILPLIFLVFAYPVKRFRMKKEAKYAKRLAFTRAEVTTLEAPKTLHQALLDKHGVDTQTTFEYRYLDKAREHDNALKQLDTKKQSLKALSSDIEKVDERIAREQAILDTIKKKYDILNYDELKRYREGYINYQDLTKTIESYTMRINDHLGNTTVETLKSSIDFQLDQVNTDDLDEVRKTVETLRKTLNDHQLSTQSLHQKIETKEKSMRPLEDVQYELDILLDKKDRLERSRATIERALARIEEAVLRIEENFAPKLSESIGHYVNTFTDQRYADIRVSKALDFKVYDTRFNRLEAKMHFSRGTIDQVYFAMRLGMLDSLNQHTAPLLLDDAFVSYDDERLAHALNVLSTMQKQRQILLFTCQRREAQTLDKLNIAYHKEWLNG